MRYQGQLVEWNDEQGYGFIQPLDERQQAHKIFLHIKAFENRGPRPITGAMLEYNVALDSQGRPNAQQVSYVRRKQAQQNHINQNQPNQKHSSQNQSSQQRNRQAQLKQNQFKQHWRGWLITVYAVLIIALVMTQQLPLWVLIVPVLLSGLNYAFYTTDKQAAQQGRRRIPEKNLHLVAVLGGWPGALLAQQRLRHKSAKTEFLQVFWLTVVINWLLVGLVAYFKWI